MVIKKSAYAHGATITETTNIDMTEGINVTLVGRQQRALKFASRTGFRDMWTQAFRASSRVCSQTCPRRLPEIKLVLPV